MMETCVTVYWMRLCHQLLRLTGEVKYADELERSLYNAIFGALKPDGRFFEYFPRFNGTRNPKVNYSFNIKGFDLSCCTANGPTGLGMAPYLAFSGIHGGVAVNLYESGTVRVPFEGAVVTLAMESDYPMMGKATLRVVSIEGELPERAVFTVSLRVPSFASDFTVMDLHAPENRVTGYAGSYLNLGIHIAEGFEWLICFDIPLVKHPAPHGSNRAGDSFVAFTYGSILLARDARDGVAPLTPIQDGEIGDWRVTPSERDGFLTVYVTVGDTELKLIDYMTAGNDWNHTAFASWLPLA
jgi:DUF1680 family protein